MSHITTVCGEHIFKGRICRISQLVFVTTPKRFVDSNSQVNEYRCFGVLKHLEDSKTLANKDTSTLLGQN